MGDYEDFSAWINPPAKETQKGGPGSGNFGHQGIPGHWGGSQPKKGKVERGMGTMPGTRPEPGHVRAGNQAPVRQGSSRNLVDRMMGGGFTYSVKKGRHVTSGFAVSVFPENEEIHSIEEFKSVESGRKIIADYWRKHMKTLSNPKVNLGGWFDPETQRAVLDCSVVVKSAKEAEALCHKFNQEGYCNLANFETTHVAGARPGWEKEVPAWMNSLKGLEWFKNGMLMAEKSTKENKRLPTRVVMEKPEGEMPTDEEIDNFLKALLGDDYPAPDASDNAPAEDAEE
jgi:hypothetical protein